MVRFVAGVVGTPLAYAVAVRPLEGGPAVVASLVLGIGAIDLIVSGVRGFCPVYRFVSVPWATRPRATDRAAPPVHEPRAESAPPRR